MSIEKDEYEKLVNMYFEDLSNENAENASEILTEFLIYILKSYKKGVIDSKELAYTIAGTMQFKITENHRYREIVKLAGEYELPDPHISGNPQGLFSRLIIFLEGLE